MEALLHEAIHHTKRYRKIIDSMVSEHRKTEVQGLVENGEDRSITCEDADEQTTKTSPSISVPFTMRKETGATPATSTSNPNNDFIAGQLSNHYSFWNSFDITRFVSAVLFRWLDIHIVENF